MTINLGVWKKMLYSEFPALPSVTFPILKLQTDFLETTFVLTDIIRNCFVLFSRLDKVNTGYASV